MKPFRKTHFILMFLLAGLAAFSQNTSDDVQKLIGQGIALHDAGKFTEAIEKYDQALQLDPNSSKAYYEKAYSLFISNKPKDAIPVLEKLLQVNPKAGGGYDILGTIYDADKQPDKAIEIYKKGIDADPEYQRLHFNLAISYYRQGKFAEAETCAIDAVKLDPKHASSMRIYAMATYKEDKKDCSLAAWCSFILLEPQTKRSAEAYTYIRSILNYGITKKDEKNINISISSSELGTERLGMSMAVVAATLDKKDLTPTDSLSLQLKSVFEITAERAANKPSFFATYLAKYFGDLAKTENMPAFARLISLAAYKDESLAWFKAHPKELDDLNKWIQTTQRSF